MIKVAMSSIWVHNSLEYKLILTVLQLHLTGFITGLSGVLLILLTFTFAQFSYVHVAAMKSLFMHELSGMENGPALLVSRFDPSGQLIWIRTETRGAVAAGKTSSLFLQLAHAVCSSTVQAGQSACRRPSFPPCFVWTKEEEFYLLDVCSRVGRFFCSAGSGEAQEPLDRLL